MSHLLHMLDERGAFEMSFVIEEASGKLIVVDGGMTEDTAHLLEYIGGRTVDAWFLTHAHSDHITAFMDIMEYHGNEVEVEKIYCNFPPLSFVQRYEPEEAPTQERFDRLKPLFADRLVTLTTGDEFSVGGLKIEVLYHYREDKPVPRQCILNSTSMVFRVSSPSASVLFLGDCDPTSGDILLAEQGKKLKSDYVQMAHHGHSGVSADVYMEIMPRGCFWCAPDWLYNEPPTYFGDRLYGEVRQREWMDKLGVTEHYVTKDGTQTLALPE